MQNTTIEGFRLSPQQKHLWLLQQNGYDSIYRVQGTILIEGTISSEILKAALEDVVHRYEILNTTFHHLPGLAIPVQVINENNGISLTEHNLNELKPREQKAKIDGLFREINQSSFDLEQGPLFKISQVILSPTQRLLHISLPALCADSTTIKNLLREISETYKNERDGEQKAANETMQYADISEWQNELLESEEAESGKEYWGKQSIADFLNFRLPFEKSAAEKGDFKPENLSLKVDSDLAVKIRRLIEQHKTSASIFFLTCWQILFRRLTGQTDFVIGTACDGRTYEELQETLGLLAKYLPLRCHLEEDVEFAQLLEETGNSVNEMLEAQEYFSFEAIAQSDNGAANPAFFPLCFNYEELSKYSLSDISFSIHRQYACIDRFKLKLSCVRDIDTLTTEFHYDSTLTKAEDVKGLAGQFHALLKSIVENSEAAIGDFEIVTNSERQKLLVEFNNTKADYPKDKCIHSIIEEQAERSPDAAAVIFEDGELKYRELDSRANQLANHLQKQGVGPEVPVGIYMEPSLEMIVAITGILKAGGAYVPLDAEYPAERLMAILEDTKSPVLLTQAKLKSDISESSAQVICLDSEWGRIKAESADKPENDVSPENLAYIIYTSGSTGKPKGVPITHQNLVHSTSARLNYYKEPVDRFLLLSSFAFDSSIVGLFWSLCSGGMLVLPTAGLQRDPLPVADLIADKQITHLLCLPSLYSLILSEANSKKLASLKTVIVAGEACTKDSIDLHKEMLCNAELLNEYGPTECSVWSIVYDCLSQELETIVPIGKPIANSQVYLLNSRMRPVPVGVPGELYIGGPGLSRGYLNRPEQTAEKFVPNPFGDEPGARLYSTGDFALYLPDGNIEFLGRADQQVKIRGYRIELGEIEAVLSQHPDVQEGVVDARETSSEGDSQIADKRLVAYLISKTEEKPATAELRAFLKKRLPDFMVPSAFVFLNAFPLTPNGKVDRTALPEPDRTRPDLAETFVAPTTAVEEVLTGIWAEVLNIEQAGIHDNFFELGGHSILVTQLVSRIRDALQVELALRTVFDAPTVFELTEVLFQDEGKRTQIEKRAELLVKLSKLSEDEAEKMLEEQI